MPNISIAPMNCEDKNVAVNDEQVITSQVKTSSFIYCFLQYRLFQRSLKEKTGK